MRQSTVIFGTLVFAFVVYITVRGQLPAYLALFTGAKVSSPNAAPSGGSIGKSFQETFDEYFSNMGFGK